ncbi:FAD-binding and (Fe-S)-binding domain-containing protein [Amphritea sp. 1_MG-2023]|uniref:D-2-hydroxyglutarate dehydrogenase YdiJ n=1 Tax=Amphritea sp. 1_MG-2023 TaxID=3062670 RepID=UPI0026E44DCB|nr:FAD-binding and (Fe-S)-binding domain-containing protein [Amphritea sp. 1_MG-2023]MDO6563142.1 FAD-binding and (Fe-S)-binding domain-containing protein [Amphritea sp. 1_MG-2023]
MIPRIAETNITQQLYLDFIKAIKSNGFKGEMNPDYASRIVLSTDNSIYQVLPQGVVFPKGIEDLVLLARLADEPRFKEVVLSARGGGTGTNGQSLTDGLIVDISRHMNQILEINAAERWVRVQGGVVKDQLNAALKPYGLFFAPELSTSNRATIGGMINTDASGQGSCLYGKTRDHVLELTSVFLDGTQWSSGPLNDDALAKIKQRDDRVGEVHRVVDTVFTQHEELIDAKFPKLNRCLTGYDLAHIRDENGRFNLNSVLCGAEGSLAFIAEAKLNVLPIPKYSALVNVKYAGFQDSLKDAAELMAWGPTSIETVDSKVLNLAMGDIVWDSVKAYFPQTEGEPSIQGINLVEYTGDDEAELQQKITKLTTYLDSVSGEAGKSFGYSVVMGAAEVNKIWGMRKKSVGLLGNGKGEQRPIPFVEDTAVPPENLAAYIAEFRALLDSHNLAYGMFGHVDAGVLHVRPAIDMKSEDEEKLIRVISDGVVALTQKYNGLIWGEHGKGVRSEYAPAFFGELYPQLQEIKGAFDPANQLNPGKICTPLIDGAELLKIDAVPTRGQHDRQIPENARDEYKQAMFCNGNGACYNYDPKDAMCPSWKATRERKHSPKGRSSLIREWLRLMSLQGVDVVAEGSKARYGSFIKSLPGRIKNSLKKQRGEYDFNHEVHEAMMGCLACKSCVAQCPIKVNVPDFRSRFLEAYYSRYLRPVKDYMVGGLEYMIPYLARFPAPYNWMMNNTLMKAVFRRWVGMMDSPPICTHSLKQGMDERGTRFATPENLAAIIPEQRERSVIIVQDAFTSYFETRLVLDLIDLLSRTGFNVLVAPFKPNGKPLHVHGFKAAFNKAADANTQMLQTLASSGIAMVGIDPSMTLTYRQEYVDDGTRQSVKVELIQEWLARHTELLAESATDLPHNDYKLMAHCSEKTSAAASMADWRAIFQALGQRLELQPTGCCGMAGTYGHESENYETSKQIYDLSWSEVVNDPANEGKLVATGYSCRSQVKRLDEKQLLHPVQILLALLKQH